MNYYYRCYNETDQIEFLKHLENLNKNYRWKSEHKPTDFIPAQILGAEEITIHIEDKYYLYYKPIEESYASYYSATPFPYKPNPYEF